jgi:hypothetical protein
MTLATKTFERVYVALLDEGLDVWRPTEAKKLGNGSYELLPTPDYDPEVEKWEFPPGSRVMCERRKLSNGNVLTAVRLAGANRRTA